METTTTFSITFTAEVNDQKLADLCSALVALACRAGVTFNDGDVTDSNGKVVGHWTLVDR